MSAQAMGWALDQDIPSRAKLILVALANHADHTTGHCWPSIATLMKEGSCSRGAVFNYLAALKRNGYVMVAHSRGDDGRGRANNYWILPDREPGPWMHLKRDETEENNILPEAEDIAEDEDAATSPGIQSPQRGLSEIAQNEPPEPVENSGQSPPCGRGVVHAVDSAYIMLEPSESKPSKTSQVTGPSATPNESPPPKPQAAIEKARPSGFDPKARQRELDKLAAAEAERTKNQRVFVFEGSEAWKAHLADHKARTGIGSLPTCWETIDGKRRLGWWFKTLFPPKSTGPPRESLMSENDHGVLAGEMER